MTKVRRKFTSQERFSILQEGEREEQYLIQSEYTFSGDLPFTRIFLVFNLMISNM